MEGGRSALLTALYYWSNASLLWVFKTQGLVKRGKGVEKERWERKTGQITVMNSFFVSDVGQSVFGSSREEWHSSSARS